MYLSKASNLRAFNFLMRRLVGNSAESSLRHASATSSLLQSRAATHTCSSTRSPEYTINEMNEQVSTRCCSLRMVIYIPQLTKLVDAAFTNTKKCNLLSSPTLCSFLCSILSHKSTTSTLLRTFSSLHNLNKSRTSGK